MLDLRTIRLLALSLGLIACSAKPDASPEAAKRPDSVQARPGWEESEEEKKDPPRGDGTPLATVDSCDARWAYADTASTNMPVDSSGDVQAFRGFSLFVPHAATVRPNADSTEVELGWSHCGDCSFKASIEIDSAVDSPERIEEGRKAKATLDSIRKANPDDVEEGSPPRLFRTKTLRGSAWDEDCGDCAGTNITLRSGVMFGHIHITVSDMAKEMNKRMCELAAVARTFAFKPEVAR